MIRIVYKVIPNDEGNNILIRVIKEGVLILEREFGNILDARDWVIMKGYSS
ncbi:MAG: hypothetical protein ACXW2E_01475 [Nitrososphaeraceae archaeon]